MRHQAPRLRLRYFAVLMVLVWAGYFYIHVQHRQLAELSAKEMSLQSQLAASQRAHAKLVSMARQFQDPTFIQRYAAEHFNLILPNQVAFTVKH